MKILVLTSTFPRWENDTDPPFVFDLARRLANVHKIYVLAPHMKGALTEEMLDGLIVKRFRYAPGSLEKLAYNGGIVTNLKRNPLKVLLIAPFLLAELLSAYKIIREQKIDLIHAHWIIPQGFIAVLLNNLLDHPVKLLCTAHGADVYTGQGSVLMRLKRFVLDHCDAITTVSSSMKKTLQAMGVTTRTETLPMGTELTTQFIPDGKVHDDKQLVFVGRLVQKKGVNYLVEAFGRFLDMHPDYSLEIVGDGPDLPELQQLATKLGIGSAITFTGGIPHDQLPARLQTAAIAIFPFITTEEGDQEGFGLVLVEAMGCECAIITTNLPTTGDIVIDGKTGIRVRQKDTTELLKAIVKLAQNDNYRKQLATSARKHVVRKFDWNSITNDYLDLIGEVSEIREYR